MSPMKPPKACSCRTCSACGGRCPNTSRAGKCDACKQASPRTRSAASREDDRKVYQSARWKGLRRSKLAQDPWCETVGCHSIATVVDHIVALRDGGDPYPPLDALRSLCTSCHNRKTATEQHERRRRGNA